jgi:SagB-type dehydrogenase family enzyme
MEVSQLLWAAQGVTASRFRTTPSAGALYPLEVYLVAGDVDELEVGVYRYDSQIHGLKKVVTGDVRKSLANAAYWQEWVGNGAITLVFTGIYERTTGKYGPRGQRYVHMEAGHAAQNVFLQAEALGLGTVIVGAFMDSRVTSVLQLSEDEHPLSIMPVGRK